jgi:uncharacterized protein
MKIAVDTNIWISYLLGGLLQDIDKKIVLKEIKVVVSDEMLKELSEVSGRPKFKTILLPKESKNSFRFLTAMQ